MRSLMRAGIPFTATITGNSARIDCPSLVGSFESSSNIPVSQLHFINKVVKHITETRPQIVPFERPRYYQFNADNYAAREIADVVEYDLNAAYWNAANQLGYLSHELYADGLARPKSVRLVALGALAKHSKKYSFDGSRLTFIEGESGVKDTAEYFFSICSFIDLVMRDIAPLSLFYWYDAIFIPAEFAPQVEARFRTCMFDFKKYDCERVCFDGRRLKVYSSQHKKGKRIFYPPSQISRDYFEALLSDKKI